MDILKAPPVRFSREPALIFLVWIAVSGTFPIHIFVPALPEAARELQVTPAAIQFSITVYLIGLSIGQLLLGILSDRFGRRPVLVVGLFLYVLASALAAMAPNLEMLLVARVFQAIGGCSGLVLGRAITRDAAGPDRATAQLAVLGAAISIGPAFAPIVGAQLALHFGWRAIFVVLAVVNSALLLATVVTLPETYLARQRVNVKDYVRRYVGLLRNPLFLQFCIGGAFATTSFYAFVGAAPFVLKEKFGFSVDIVGVVFLVVVGSLTLGSVLASRIAGRVQPRRAIRAAVSIMTVAGLALVGLCLTDTLTFWTMQAAVMALTFSIGLCSPFAMTGAVNVEPAAIGAASGLYGCLQMAAGALIIAMVGVVPAELALAMSMVLLGASAIACVVFWLPAKLRS